MARKKKYTIDQIAQAIEEAQGFLCMAADILGCTYRTVHNYMLRSKVLQEKYENIQERCLDDAEKALLERIKDGELTAIIFFLKCQAKHRGYVERTESMQHISGKLTTGALVVPSDMTPEEWERTFCSEPGGNGNDSNERVWR